MATLGTADRMHVISLLPHSSIIGDSIIGDRMAMSYLYPSWKSSAIWGPPSISSTTVQCIMVLTSGKWVYIRHEEEASMDNISTLILRRQLSIFVHLARLPVSDLAHGSFRVRIHPCGRREGHLCHDTNNWTGSSGGWDWQIRGLRTGYTGHWGETQQSDLCGCMPPYVKYCCKYLFNRKDIRENPTN